MSTRLGAAASAPSAKKRANSAQAQGECTRWRRGEAGIAANDAIPARLRQLAGDVCWTCPRRCCANAARLIVGHWPRQAAMQSAREESSRRPESLRDVLGSRQGAEELTPTPQHRLFGADRRGRITQRKRDQLCRRCRDLLVRWSRRGLREQIDAVNGRFAARIQVSVAGRLRAYWRLVSRHSYGMRGRCRTAATLRVSATRRSRRSAASLRSVPCPSAPLPARESWP